MDIRAAIDMIADGADPHALLTERGGTLVAHYYGQQQPVVTAALPSAPHDRSTPRQAETAAKRERASAGRTAEARAKHDEGLSGDDSGGYTPLSEGETILDTAYEEYVEQHVREVKDGCLNGVSVGPLLPESTFRTILRILNTLERTQRRPDLALQYKRKLLCPV